MVNKNIKKAAKVASKKLAVKKVSPPKAVVKAVKGPAVKIVGKKIKCCNHCPDYEHCDEKDVCCDYCDFYLNGKCMYGKKKGIPSVNQEIELPDYRGDDYGIDDYEAYEPVYE